MLPSTVVGVLLAAGAGRWYGKPKVLVDGWLDTAVGALRDGGCNDVILVLGAVEVSAPAGVTAITAPDWQQGLSASVRAGLAQADREHADYAVLHVIDTPDVNAKVVAIGAAPSVAHAIWSWRWPAARRSGLGRGLRCRRGSCAQRRGAGRRDRVVSSCGRRHPGSKGRHRRSPS